MNQLDHYKQSTKTLKRAVSCSVISKTSFKHVSSFIIQQQCTYLSEVFSFVIFFLYFSELKCHNLRKVLCTGTCRRNYLFLYFNNFLYCNNNMFNHGCHFEWVSPAFIPEFCGRNSCRIDSYIYSCCHLQHVYTKLTHN